MSAAKKLVLVVALTVTAVALGIRSSSAQGSPGNPSGGTGCSPAREVGGASMLPTDYLSRGLVLGVRLESFRAWATTVVATEVAWVATSPAAFERKAFLSVPRKARVR